MIRNQHVKDTAFSFTPSALGGRAALMIEGVFSAHCQFLPPPPSPARQPGVLPSNQATLHLLSGIMSTPPPPSTPTLLLLAQANFPFSLDYPFSFPLFSTNGLTMCLPVTSPPLLASREESLNLSSLKGWVCGGRNAGLLLGMRVSPPGLHCILASSVTIFYGMFPSLVGSTHGQESSVSFQAPPQSSTWLSLCLWQLTPGA